MDYQLFQIQETENIVAQQTQRFLGITIALILLPYGNAHLSPGMHGRKLCNIDGTYQRIILCTYNHHTQLAVGKHIAFGILNILFQDKSGIGYGEVRHIPSLGIILHSIHHFQVFRLHSTETHPFTAEIRFIHIFQSVTFLLLY